MAADNPGEELIQQQARHQRLLREHAVLEAREAEKTRRRDEIRTLLKKAGVDPDRPDEEKRRLDAETAAVLAENNRLLDEFETKLKTAAGTLPTEDLNAPQPERQRAPNAESEPSTTSAPLMTSEPGNESAPKALSEPEMQRAPNAMSEPPEQSAPSKASGPVTLTVEIPDDIEI